jgi:uncharacterized protein (TIGR02646 family)
VIKIARGPVPPELTTAKEAEMVATYKATGESVWNVGWLKKPLLAMAHGKCAYCETSITDESKYMEVEHYHPKIYYPEKVAEWNNLLPACKRCNGKKSKHDVMLEPIVDPSVNDPTLFFSMKNYRLKAKNPTGRSTIDAVGLNDSVRVVSKRFKIGDALAVSLEDLRDTIADYDPKGPRASSKGGKIHSKIESLLLESQANSPYAATAAHVIADSADYLWIKQELITLGIWDIGLQSLHDEMTTLRL